LIGDAAGHVNPIIGEGIMYALLDGELAAQVVVENGPQRFEGLWREIYGWSLCRDIRLVKWLYKKTFLELYCKYQKLLGFVH